MKFGGEIEGGLATELDDDPENTIVFVLRPIDVDDVFRSEGFKVEFIGGVVVGGDGLGVRVDHNGFEPLFAKCETGVHAAVIKFDALSDAVWATAENNNFRFLAEA